MGRLIPDSGVQELEAFVLDDLLPASEVLRSDPGRWMESIADMQEWLRYHFDDCQIEVIALACSNIIGDTPSDC